MPLDNDVTLLECAEEVVPAVAGVGDGVGPGAGGSPVVDAAVKPTDTNKHRRNMHLFIVLVDHFTYPRLNPSRAAFFPNPAGPK